MRRGAGSRGAARGPGLPGKRKFEGGHQNQGDYKRRQTNTNWGSNPIPQQPLRSSRGGRGGGGGGYGGRYGAASDFYTDSYGGQW